MKFCRACNETKPESSFSKSSRAKNGLQTYCKTCQVRMDTANPNRGARYARYKAKFPARVTWSSIKKRAERLDVPVLSMEDFALWLEQQPRCCEYCGMPEAEAKNQFGKRLHVDRKDGALGYVHGNLVLACHRCNVVKNGYLTHAQMMQVAGMFFGGPVNNHEALVKALKKLSLAYVSLMEIGRDRIVALGGSCDPVEVMEAGDPSLREIRDVLASVDVGTSQVRGDHG